jgi:hypothetical protein
MANYYLLLQIGINIITARQPSRRNQRYRCHDVGCQRLSTEKKRLAYGSESPAECPDCDEPEIQNCLFHICLNSHFHYSFLDLKHTEIGIIVIFNFGVSSDIASP